MRPCSRFATVVLGALLMATPADPSANAQRISADGAPQTFLEAHCAGAAYNAVVTAMSWGNSTISCVVQNGSPLTGR